MRAIRAGIALLSGSPLTKMTIPSSSYSKPLTPKEKGPSNNVEMSFIQSPQSKTSMDSIAFESATNYNHQSDYIPYLFVITDGADPNERDVCRYVSRFCREDPATASPLSARFPLHSPISPSLRHSSSIPSDLVDRLKLRHPLRIHTLGVGLHCNIFFLKILSLMGRGTVSHSLNPSNLKSDIIKMIHNADNPVLTNIRLGLPVALNKSLKDKALLMRPVPKSKKCKPLPQVPIDDNSSDPETLNNKEDDMYTYLKSSDDVFGFGKTTTKARFLSKKPSNLQIDTKRHDSKEPINIEDVLATTSINNGETQVEVYPYPIPDLMAGAPLVIQTCPLLDVIHDHSDVDCDWSNRGAASRVASCSWNRN
jgi:hypothetical protein